ncbi:MAG TPA: hypothetical protein VEQ61_08805 [Thermoleophilaceae bacterium]|nr:hypothetical protein [Thermoleophilaceae bacterium]
MLIPLLAAPGCGGDDEPARVKPADLPELTVPETEPRPTTPPEATETLTEPSAPKPEPTDGGAPAPPSSEPPPDSPENDSPPPANSPAERFEEFCRENPESCG